MAASTLRKSTSAKIDSAAPAAGAANAQDVPCRSTRELEAAFRTEGEGRFFVGLAYGLAISAALWALIAVIVF